MEMHGHIYCNGDAWPGRAGAASVLRLVTNQLPDDFSIIRSQQQQKNGIKNPKTSWFPEGEPQHI